MSEQASSEAVPRRRLVVRAVLRTDVGLVRSENQDFGTCTTPQEEEVSHPGGRLLIVADGMGGHRGGATASKLAAETVKAQYLGSETKDIPTALRDSLVRANARIFFEAQSNPDLRGMGTTTSALAVRNGQGWLAHVGDSRIYRVRDQAIEQLTDDHSLVATMVREGLLTSQEAETHPRRNVLQRSMGVSEDVEVDVRGPFDLREDDTFILCSDGLHGVVKEPELKDIAGLPIEEAADECLKRALARGAPDNVTVIVARVEATDEPEPVGAAFDDTLAIEEVEKSQFDETVKDTDKIQLPPDQRVTDKIPLVTDAEIDGIAPAAQSAESAAPALQTDATLETPVSAPTTAASHVGRDPAPASTPPKSPILKWTLVLALALGAAGAWYYWNYQHPATQERRSSSTR